MDMLGNQAIDLDRNDFNNCNSNDCKDDEQKKRDIVRGKNGNSDDLDDIHDDDTNYPKNNHNNNNNNNNNNNSKCDSIKRIKQS